MVSRKYAASGPEAEFEPGSRGRVLRNRLGIRSVREMERAESDALEVVQQAAIDRFHSRHRFSASDIGALHRDWLGHIYSWAGEYRSVNIGKGGFQFAHAPLIPGLMREFERGALARRTPCVARDDTVVAQALAEVHAELVLIHPFRDGNGRVARLLSVLMALQAGLPPLDFGAIQSGSGRHSYFDSINVALTREYRPLTDIFLHAIARGRRVALASAAKSPHD